MRRAAKIDAAQPGIVKTLRRAGVSVTITSHVGEGFPDLVCGRAGQTFLLEVKSDDGAELTSDQVDWHGAWRGHVAIVRTGEEALAAVGLPVALARIGEAGQ